MAQRCSSNLGARCALLLVALFPFACTSNISATQARGRKHTAVLPAVGDVALMDAATEEPMVEMPEASAPDVVVVKMIPDATVPPDVVNIKIEPCRALQSVEPATARSVVSSSSARPSERTVFTSDLYGLFKSNCGGCHADTNLGGFQAKDANSFAGATKSRQQQIHDRLHSDDPTQYMPAAGAPNAKPWSQRDANDPVVELAGLLDLWFAAGSPQDLFYIQNTDTESGASPYLMLPEVANKLTNIGNCLPDKAIVAKDTSKMDTLDTFFASATALPPKLDQTDLVTFDSEALARNGVISFAPLYPLFSDNARKMRHVRVPRGQSIAFDKDTQEFTIPPNTRVYKTFLKKIIEADGSEHYRKIETRLIVSRPDGEELADGTHPINALFGTYAWDEDETEATLITDPLRNGKPFRDRVVTYITDEGKANAVLATNPINKVVALREAGVTRSYAIPGSDRCIQCHEGSHNKSFLLGLTPLQLNRRPMGEGGVIDAAGADELTQMQRLIDYGVVSGMTSPDDVLPLEKAEGDRAPRNDYELTAQGYMLGNCSHCHNPRGFPTQQNPVLRDLLRFFPDRDGGIFQFPLDRVSPRIKRGLRQDISIPYITPSLVDLEGSASDGSYTPKHFGDPLAVPTSARGDVDTQGYLGAPWRSLIYRNVDTPFTYADDYALFPHMPMNSPGYDCRAPKIIGDWMVSIPARLALQAGEVESSDASAQIYQEVNPTDSDYAAAQKEAKRRLDFYHKGGRGSSVLNTSPPTNFTQYLGYRYSQYCPDTSDIVAPEVQGTTLTPDDKSSLPSLVSAMVSMTGPAAMPAPMMTVDARLAAAEQFSEGVPDRAHWVVTDITDPPPPWHPRRTDWASVLVDKMLDADADARQATVVDLLQSVRLDTAFHDFALKQVPFGIWKAKPECNFSSVPKISSFTGSDRPIWMDTRSPKPSPDDPVYMQAPGATVFNEICINCHGPKFDSRGRQADTLMLITGGQTRVANLRDGLFGPVDSPGANRMTEFGPPHAPATDGLTPDDWAVRYLAWMGLGGTQRIIPPMILRLVGTAQVLGDERPNAYDPAAKSANMLSIAQTLCSHTLGRKGSGTVDFDLRDGSIPAGANATSLILNNGDAEHWQNLCSFQNPPPVRIVRTNGWDAVHAIYTYIDGTNSWYNPATYPTDALVGDERGHAITGVSAANKAPWCVVGPLSTDTNYTSEQAAVTQFEQDKRGGEPLPLCPTAWLVDANKLSEDDLDKWTLKGAMNAGKSVFVYLNQRSQDALQGKDPPPSYDQCELLK